MDHHEFSNCLMYLDNYRHIIIEKLFGNETQGYQNEWHSRDPVAFWSHLDIGNRKRVMEMMKSFSG